jgi:hypothetical protein
MPSPTAKQQPTKANIAPRSTNPHPNNILFWGRHFLEFCEISV